MRFTDRRDAGKRLAAVLGGYGGSDALVLGIPRGGVIVAAEVSRALGAPLDLVVVRKIGHPSDPEYAIGAVDPDGGVARGAVGGVPDSYIAEEAERQRHEIARRLTAYRRGRPEPELSGKTVLLVDDGVATGLTALQAIRFARARGAARVVMAAPVMAPTAVRRLEDAADDVVTLAAPPGFSAVGGFYDQFPQTSDEEVVAALDAAAAS